MNYNDHINRVIQSFERQPNTSATRHALKRALTDVMEAYRKEYPCPKTMWVVDWFDTQLSVVMVSETAESNRWLHNCRECVYLGSSDDYDHYYCNAQRTLPTIIARWSDDDGAYLSGLGIGRGLHLGMPDMSTGERALRISYLRAKDEGLVA